MNIRSDVRCVYLILNTENNRVKIGYTSNIKSRFNQIMYQSGCEMELAYKTPPIYDYIEVERAMHDRFKKHRLIGEWFNVDVDDAIRALKLSVGVSNTCRIIAMSESGMNPTQIAKKMDVSRSGIVRYLKENEIEIRYEDKKITTSSIADMVKRNNEKIKRKKKHKPHLTKQ